jgi:pyroglutamyl-peptidase
MNRRILVTGFIPFLHHSVNSSEQVLAGLKKERTDIETLLLPVSFENSFLELQMHLTSNAAYDFVIMMGQAKGRASIIISGAPDSYIADFFPSDWAEKISAGVVDKGSKLAEMSLSAGAYVCNNLYYKAAHALNGSSTKVLFVHLPLLPEQVAENVGSPSMDLHTQSRIINELLNLLKTV